MTPKLALLDATQDSVQARLDEAAARLELADVALFLASDESSQITGVDLVVDGEMKVW